MIVRLLPILGITFIDILGFSILIPLLPFYVKHFGAPDVVVGGLFATFSFCQFIGGPVWGNVSDRIGRKRVLIVSQIGATIGWTMLAFAPTIEWVFFARVVEGFSGGNLSVTQAYVSDLVQPEQRGRAFAYIGAAFSAGLTIGPAAGGYLVARYGFATPFLFAAALQVVTLTLTVLILPESRRPTDAQPARLSDIARTFTDRRLAPVMWQKLFFSLGVYGWYAVFTLLIARQFGFDVSSTSFLFTGFGIASIVSQLGVVGRVTDRAGDRRATNLGFALLLVAFALVPFLHALTGAAVLIVVFAVGSSMVNAALPSLISSLAPDQLRGTVLGSASSLESIAGMTTPIVTTYALQAAGTPATTAICFGFVALALVLGLAQARQPVGQTPATS